MVSGIKSGIEVRRVRAVTEPLEIWRSLNIKEGTF